MSNLPHIGPSPSTRPYQHDYRKTSVAAYGERIVTDDQNVAYKFALKKSLEHAIVKQKYKLYPTTANSISMFVYTLRINLTTCHGECCQLFGLLIFLWIYMTIAACLLAFFIIILVIVLIVGITQLNIFAYSYCCKCCKRITFKQSYTKAWLGYTWEYLKIMATIGWQPKAPSQS